MNSELQVDRIIIGIIGMDDHGPDEPVPPNALKAAEEIGVWSQTTVLPESASEGELL